MEVKASLEGGPEFDEVGRSEEGVSGGGVCDVLDEVEVSTKKGVNVRISCLHATNELAVETEVATRFEVDVEELEGFARSVDRVIDAKLNVTSGNRWESHIFPAIKFAYRWSVNDGSATTSESDPRARD